MYALNQVHIFQQYMRAFMVQVVQILLSFKNIYESMNYEQFSTK